MLRAPNARFRSIMRRSVIVHALLASEAAATPCEPVRVQPDSEQRDKVLERAREAAHSGRLAEARSLFHWLTERNPTDQEAWLGLSLVNAWDGCHEQAEGGFRYLLQRNARDVEARAALIDVLTWRAEWPRVWEQLDAGLALDPNAPALLYRQAKLTFWSGDASLARARLQLAVRNGAHEPEVKFLGRQLFLDQLRTFMRVDTFPAGYPNIYSWGMHALHRLNRFEIMLGTSLYRHSGGREDMMVDGRHHAGLLYHPAMATSVGVSVGFGSPARWVPDLEARLWTVFPLVKTFSGFFSYAIWQYGQHKSVHIFAPALGYTIRDELSLELRWWSSYVALHTPPQVGDAPRTGLVHSIGLLGRVRLAPELTVGATYTYGTQLDENPIISRLFPLRSHVASFFSDWALAFHYGIQPQLGFERRQAPHTAVHILSGEMGVYWRW